MSPPPPPARIPTTPPTHTLTRPAPLVLRAARDPFVRLAPDGVYRMVATDGATVGRSPDILYWESTNLVDWSPMRRLPVMASLKDDIIFTWAPEWVWDEERKEYLVFFATFFRHWQGAAGCDNHTNIGRRHLFWSVRTTDWKTFTAPEMLFDPSCNAATFSPMNYSEGGIDGDILRAPDGRYHMVYKDGRSPERTSVTDLQRTSGARMTVSTDLKSWSTPVPAVGLFGTPWGIEGPELLTINASKMHLYYDCAWHKLPPGSGDPYPNPPYGVSTVSCHDIAAIWVAFFSRCQRYRC